MSIGNQESSLFRQDRSGKYHRTMARGFGCRDSAKESAAFVCKRLFSPAKQKPTLTLGLWGPKDTIRTSAPTSALLLPTARDRDAHTPGGRRRRHTGSHTHTDRIRCNTLPTRRPRRLPSRTRPVPARVPPSALPPTSPLRQQHPQHHRRVTSEHLRNSHLKPHSRDPLSMQSEPETTISPSATVLAHPELLSPEAANRPLPQDDPGQHQHQPQSQPQHHHHHHHAPSDTYDTAQRSGTPSTPWPAGFIPYTPSIESRPASERERRRAHPDHTPTPDPNRSKHSRTHPPNGYTRTRTQTAPLPPGVTYPAPPVRPHTSHRRHKDKERVRDVGRERDWDRDLERERVRDRDRDGDGDRDRRPDSRRDYERERERERDRDRDREQDPEDTGVSEELTRSPAPLQRPISLFDSDEA
ncbi:hypothetical protein J3R83DRAFT_1480 [Lanmaoa asiatica]|nr:hypothetical protein J3R83DRAFT_1480 [Lanmaoa asiatica]